MIESCELNDAVSIMASASKTVALTGAGISVESGIAPFRGKGGLWEKYDPYEYAHIDSFLHDPDKSWVMLKDMGEQIFRASPNPAHQILTQLQKQKCLGTIITQNVDNLHQEAGSMGVIDFHGNYKHLVCLFCGKSMVFKPEMLAQIPPSPRCDCGHIFKPNVVLFGESPALKAMKQSEKAVLSCDVLLVIGTSAVIYPAAHLPVIAKNNHATIIEINRAPSQLTKTLTDVFIHGSAGTILPLILDRLNMTNEE